MHGGIETSKRLLKVIQEAEQRYDVFASSAGPSISMGLEYLRDATTELTNRGIRIRYLTDITKENLSYCKELAAIADVRHTDGIKGGFFLSEREFIGSATLREKEPVPHLICSNAKEVMEQQNYIFEAFWSKGVPAEQRFEELESGKKPEFLNVINDPKQAVSTILDLASSVEREALLILPKGLMISQQQMLLGFLDRLIDSTKRKNAEVRIIGPAIAKGDSTHYYGLAEWLRDNIDTNPIKFREGNASNQMMLIIDNSSFLRTELKTSEKAFYSSFENTLGFTAYSNSRPAVASFKSLFEMIWTHLEVIEKLNALGKSREEFISVAAHELRSPVTPILLMAGLWKKGKAQDEASIRMVTRSAEKLDRLIRDVLEMSRVESRSLNLEKERLDISELAEELVLDTNSELEQESKSDKVKLVFGTVGPDDGSKKPRQMLVNADKGRIADVISNLLSNAIKFTERGTIRVEVGVKEDRVLVSVRDEGKGIDPEILPRLFTKYATKSHMGTGIGLYVSKNIIEVHGGKIWAENNPDGRGASFFFTLPLAEATAAYA